MVRDDNKSWALEPAGTYRVGSVWKPGLTNGTEEFFFLGPGDPVVTLSLGVGGSLASFPRDCVKEAEKKRDELKAQFAAANLNRFVGGSVQTSASAYNGQPPQVYAPAVTSNPPADTPPPAPACASWGGGNDPTLGYPWVISAGDSYAVANVWTNAAPGSPVWKVFLRPGESVSVASGGGDVTYWPGNCGNVADGNYKSNGNGVFSEAALTAFINANSAPPPPAPTAPPAASCNGVELPARGRDQGPDTVWTIGGDSRSYVALVWNPERGEGEFKLYVGENTSNTLKGYGGSVWAFPPGCAAESNTDYQSKAYPPL